MPQQAEELFRARDAVCVPGEEIYLEEHDSLWCAPAPDGTLAWWKEYRNPPVRAQVQRLVRSRAHREWIALRAMARAGLPVPKPLACLEWRRRGALERSMLITADVPGTRDLAALAADPETPAELLHTAARAVGQLARRVHEAGFVHFRFLARNLLVELAHPEKVWILDTPYATAWPRNPPYAHRRFDLQTLACARGSLPTALAEEAIRSYDPGLDPSRWVHAPRRRLKIQRILYFTLSSWTGNLPRDDA